MRLAGRRVVLGVSGGIACYKSCILVRRLREAGVQVDVVMTRGAMRFVRPVTFEALSGRPVRTSLWARGEALDHVRLAREAVPEVGAPPVSEALAMEMHITMQDNALGSGLLQVGQLTPYTCPTCHGALLQLKAGRFIRFRCHTGHAFSARSLLVDLQESIDDTLWNTLRGLDESLLLMQHMARHLRQEAGDARYRADVDNDRTRAAEAPTSRPHGEYRD